MKALFTGLLSITLLFGVMNVFAGQNENASISIDFNYDQSGNQGMNAIDAPGVAATVYFEVRIDNCSKFDTYFFELLYSTEDLIYDDAWTDNVKGDDEEDNILKSLGAGVIDAPAVIDSSGTVGVITFSRTNDTNDPALCPTGEGLLGLFRFKTKVAAPRSVEFKRVEWYDVDGVMDLCKQENKGEGFMGGGSLPVKLSSFTARENGESILLEWSTESEKDSWGFNILRSTAKDGTYERVNAELVQAAGNSRTRIDYEYTDVRVEKGVTYYYKLEQIDLNGAVSYYGPVKATIVDGVNTVDGAPVSFVLHDNYPNPFNPRTTIRFELPKDEYVTLDIFNIAGAKIRTLVSAPFQAGVHSVGWDGTNDYGDKVSSGAYLYKFTAGAFTKNSKMMFLN